MKKLLSVALAAALLLALALPALADETADQSGGTQAEPSVPLARSETPLSGQGARAQETALGDLIADALLWYAAKDGALEVERQYVAAVFNGGGIQAGIEAGQVTLEDIRAVLPGGDTVAVVYLPGGKLLEALEAATAGLPEATGDFPQVAGLELTVDAAVPYDQGGRYGESDYYAPASIRRVSIQSAGGWTFDPEATYAVVTTAALAAGEGGYYALSASGRAADTGAAVEQVVMDYIATQLGGAITAAAYGESRGRVHIAAPAMWYDQAVETVTALGLMTGTGNGFDPDALVTRATVFQTLYNLEGRPATTGVSAFPDAAGAWYGPAADWAAAVGLAQGTGAGFEGERAISRAEIVVILARYAQYKGADLRAGDGVELLSLYWDAELLNAWSVDAFRWAVGAGILSGRTGANGTALDPGQTATRAELAQILVNFTDFFPVRPVAEELTPPDSRSDYPSDGAYANFRAVAVGEIAPGALYRSSSPIDPDQGERRLVADALLAQTQVRTVVNTADCRQRFTLFPGYGDTHYATLNHVALRMEKDFAAEGFVQDLRNGLDFMAEEEGPYLIHGTQGVERTGYVCMVLEALMGARREEIVADYMRSYADYYQLDPDSPTWRAMEARAEGYLAAFTGGQDDLAQATEDYLLQVVGLTREQVELLKAHLS